MSLEELLKDSDGSAKWKNKRKQIFRAFIGIAVILTALILLAIVLRPEGKKPAKPDPHDADVGQITRLLQLKQETSELQRQLAKQQRAPAKVSNQRMVAPAPSPKASAVLVNYDPGESFLAIEHADKEVYIPTGSVFQARLITPIKTAMSRTFVLAETTHEYRMDQERRIPKGSRLVGRARLDPILRSVVVEFDTLVLPSGIETRLSGLALSDNALPSIEGLYISDSLQNYGAVLAFGFIGGFANASRARNPSFWGFLPEQTVENQVLAGFSAASFEVAEEVVRDIRNRAVEYVVVPAGELIFIALTRRYDINPKQEKEEKAS